MPAKYDRMRQHIQSSGAARGLSGRQLDQYVFGAMRARGWKPKRELKENLVKDAFKGVKDTLNTPVEKLPGQTVHKLKHLSSPLIRYRKARLYAERGRQALSRGEYDRGLSMIHRGTAVMQRHAPEAIGTAVGLGLAAGANVAAPLIPGTTEVSVLAGRTGGRFVARAMRAKARAQIKKK